jgi:hypothetical protein
MSPIGRLLRAVAAETVSQGLDEAGDRLAYRCIGWARRIPAMLAGMVRDREIRGALCGSCEAMTWLEYGGDQKIEADKRRLDDFYRARAIAVRVAVLDDPGPDDLWVYRVGRACGDEGGSTT